MKIDEVDPGEEYVYGSGSGIRRVRVMKIVKLQKSNYGRTRAYRALVLDVLDSETGVPLLTGDGHPRRIETTADKLHGLWSDHANRNAERNESIRIAQEAADSFNVIVDAVKKAYGFQEGTLNRMVVTYRQTAAFPAMSTVQQVELIANLHSLLMSAETDNDGQRVIYLPAE